MINIYYKVLNRSLKNAITIFLLAVTICYNLTLSQDWSLGISGDVKQSMILRSKDFLGLPHSKVTTTNRKGITIEYEGVSLFYLLQKVGAPLGDSTEGKNQTWYVQAEATDGYKVIFALPEIDTSFTKNNILVADKKNGGSLDTNAVPLMIVVSSEQRHGRWIRHLSTLRVLRATQ
jgi:hypothetical protein